MNETLNGLHRRFEEQNAMLGVLVVIIGVLALLVLLYLLAKLINTCCCRDARRRTLTPGMGGEPTGSSTGSTNGSAFGSYQPRKRNFQFSDFIVQNGNSNGHGVGGFNGSRVYNGHGHRAGGGDGAGCA